MSPFRRIAHILNIELGEERLIGMLAERPEMATGIIRVLTHHLRNRVRDVTQLDSRVHELESKLPNE